MSMSDYMEVIAHPFRIRFGRKGSPYLQYADIQRCCTVKLCFNFLDFWILDFCYPGVRNTEFLWTPSLDAALLLHFISGVGASTN